MSEVFKGTTALVTGASSGLGEEFARQIAGRGANVVLVARTASKLEALAAELAQAQGVRAQALPMDLSAADAGRALCEELASRGLVIDHLINNAGFGLHGRFVKLDPARESEMLRLNMELPTALAHALLPGMVERRRGGILNVASTGAFQPVPGMATYAATKAYVLSLTIGLSVELRGTGVRALALCPGPVPTGFQNVAGIDIAPQHRMAVLTAAETVRRGLRAYEKGRAVIVPGTLNSLGALGTRLVSQRMSARIAARVMGARLT